MSENVNVDQNLRRFQPKPCRACHGISKTKCMFCGQQWTLRKIDMSDFEIIQFDAYRSEIKRLQVLYNKLLALKMKSTGCESQDKLVILHIGDWRNLI
jgi:hypothetical protein